MADTTITPNLVASISGPLYILDAFVFVCFFIVHSVWLLNTPNVRVLQSLGEITTRHLQKSYVQVSVLKRQIHPEPKWGAIIPSNIWQLCKRFKGGEARNKHL